MCTGVGYQLKIGGKKFKVIMTDQVCKDSLFFGQVDFVKQTISIDRTPNIDTQRETLLHIFVAFAHRLMNPTAHAYEGPAADSVPADN